MNDNLYNISKKIRVLLKKDELTSIKHLISSKHPVDVIDILLNFELNTQKVFFKLLPDNMIVDILGELEDEHALVFLGILKPARLIKILNLMPNDEVTDILSELSSAKRTQLLNLMDKDDADDVKELLDYEDDTAGGIMTTEYLKASPETTVEKVFEIIRSTNENPDSINYLYVVDEVEHLVGIVTVKKLLVSSLKTKIKDIMVSKDMVISVPPDMDQEEVAMITNRYNLLSMPVVDYDGVILGIVTLDDIVDIMEAEVAEDIYKLIGSDEKEEDIGSSVFQIVALRLPWLILCLVMGICSGQIIHYFKASLEKVVALSYFIPVILGMAGNVGTQSATIMVRKLALSSNDYKKCLKHLGRDILIGLFIGLCCGIVLGTIVFFWQNSLNLAIVVSSSMLIILTVSAFLGTIIPLALQFLNIDPAYASGPFVTTLNDLTGLTVYFILAGIFIKYFNLI